MTEAKPPIEQPTGFTYKYKRLYDLGSDRLGIIETMLTNGDSPATVATHVQVDWGQCQNVKHGTLEKQIFRYRTDVLDPKLVLAAENAVEKGITNTASMAKMRETVDVMEKLDEFIIMQGARIKKAYQKEALKGPDGKLDPAINKELRPFTDMCRVLAGLQLETGVVRRVPKQVQGFFQQLDTSELQDFRMEMSANDETLKSLGMIKDVLQDAAHEILDGEFIPLDTKPIDILPSNVETVESDNS